MRTTVTLDDDLLARALELMGHAGRGQLLNEALRALIEREAARRLILLSGSVPAAPDIPRRRSVSNDSRRHITLD